MEFHELAESSLKSREIPLLFISLLWMLRSLNL